MYYNILPETLKTHRDRLGWSQQTLAEKARISRKTVIEKETHDGLVKVRDFIAKGLARALDVEIADLAKPIPEELFSPDIDVFHLLRRSLGERDDYHTFRILEYISYQLAEVLDIAELVD